MLAGICTDGLLRPFQTTSLWFSPGSARHSSSDSFSLSVLAWTHSLIFMDLYMCIEFCWIVNQMQDGISSSIQTFNNTFLSIFSPHGSISPSSFLYLRPISLLLPSSNLLLYHFSCIFSLISHLLLPPSHLWKYILSLSLMYSPRRHTKLFSYLLLLSLSPLSFSRLSYSIICVLTCTE